MMFPFRFYASFIRNFFGKGKGFFAGEYAKEEGYRRAFVYCEAVKGMA